MELNELGLVVICALAGLSLRIVISLRSEGKIYYYIEFLLTFGVTTIAYLIAKLSSLEFHTVGVTIALANIYVNDFLIFLDEKYNFFKHKD